MSSPISQKPVQEMPAGRVKKTNSTGSRIKISDPKTTLKVDNAKDAIPTNSKEEGSESPKSPKLKTHSYVATGIDFRQLKLAEGKRTFGQGSKDY